MMKLGYTSHIIIFSASYSYINNYNDNNSSTEESLQSRRARKTGCPIFLSIFLTIEYMVVARQRRHVALFHGAFCVSRQHRLCRR